MLSCLSLTAAAAVAGMCPPVHCLILPTWQDAWTAEQSFWPQGHDPPLKGHSCSAVLYSHSAAPVLERSRLASWREASWRGNTARRCSGKRIFARQEASPRGRLGGRQLYLAHSSLPVKRAVAVLAMSCQVARTWRSYTVRHEISSGNKKTHLCHAEVQSLMSAL